MPSLKRSPFSEAQFPEEAEPGDRKLEKIVFISSFVPRACGIATYCNDLRHSLVEEHSDIKSYVIAMDDRAEGYEYDRQIVRFQISEKDTPSYHRAADYINSSNVSCVCVQMEYGLYAGGAPLVSLLRQLRVPVVSIHHTLLEKPSIEQKRILSNVVSLSTRVVTMARKGKEILEAHYSAPANKIDVIEHGIPDSEFPDRVKAKKELGFENHTTLMTFGLLSPGKGIEYGIKATAIVAKKFPDVRYIVAGATHPGIVRDHGESYRMSLIHLAEELGISENVVFIDKFLDLSVLKTYIQASDVYLVPYLSKDQITSGTLAWSCGIGAALVSTPFHHAVELCDEGRGFLVPFRQHEPMAEKVIELLGNDELRNSIYKKCYEWGRTMTWSATSHKYRKTFEQALSQFDMVRESNEPTTPGTPLGVASALTSRALSTPYPMLSEVNTRLPQINLNHLIRMTDDVGIIQHAKFSVPDRNHGYSIDDVARALNLLTQFNRYELDVDPRTKGFSSIYLGYIQHAFDYDKRRFHNFMSFSRQWMDKPLTNTEFGSEDSHGRCLQALSAVVRFGQSAEQLCANELFLYAMPTAENFISPRAWAYSMIGLRDYVAATNHHEARQIMEVLAAKLLKRFKDAANNQDGWLWTEDTLTYDNAIMPQALICVGRLVEDDEMSAVGGKALKWLFDKQIVMNKFAPIGNLGWATRDGKRALWDQQSLEPGSMAMSCISAMHSSSGDQAREWFTRARVAQNWYFGSNLLGEPLYDPVSGGVYDALHENRRNSNMGAESLLQFLLGLAAVKAAERELGEVPTTQKMS